VTPFVPGPWPSRAMETTAEQHATARMRIGQSISGGNSGIYGTHSLKLKKGARDERRSRGA
jgi:hypothetical protein